MRETMGVTIKDIAKRAGVSYSTVSRALNGVQNVNPERRDKILEIAEEMGYVPNINAVNLKLAKSNTIGLYFSTIGKMTSPFVLHDVVSGVYSAISSSYSVVVKGIDLHVPNTLNPACFDGIIVLSQRSDDHAFIDECMRKDIPVVVINRVVPNKVSTVLTDEAKGTEMGMDYLLDNGHRNIAIIEGNPDLDSTKTRHIGWKKSYKKHGLDWSNVPIATGNYRYITGYNATKLLLESKPTAIFAFNDEMAFGAAKAIQEAGLSIPEDVSIMGFDNLDLQKYSSIPLTTIERNMAQIAKKGAQVLMDKIERGNNDTERILLDTKLVIRDSVKTK